MEFSKFKIIVPELTWLIEGQDDPEDLCSHGRVRVCLDDTTLEDGCCTSASAMRMLRTLTEDHLQEEPSAGQQMLPCCGHFMVADASLQNVYIDGCHGGTDYEVLHRDGAIYITTETGQQFIIDPKDYRREVLGFAQAVEDFYAVSTPKRLPDDRFDRDGYVAFWNEWRRRKAQAEAR